MKEKKAKHVWPFSFYFLFFAAVAVYGPYRILYYQSLSFTGAQIGVLAGIAPLVTLIGLPLIAGLADRTERHKLIMSIALLVLISGVCLLPYMTTFFPQLILAILLGLSFSTTTALSNNAAMFMLGEQKTLFGRIRLGGTIGFSIFATVAGIIVEEFGLKIAFWSAAFLFGTAFATSQKLIHGEKETEPLKEKVRATKLLKKPRFLLFLILSFTAGMAFATINTYLFPYMETLGTRESLMGLALTIGTLAEMPILFFMSYFIQRFKAYSLVIFSIAMTGVRLLLLASTSNPIFVILIQILNGVNYPLLLVSGVTYADEQAPKGFHATAQGLFSTAMGGIGTALGGFIGGLLFDQFGAKRMYLVFGSFVVIVVCVVFVLHRTLPAEQKIEQVRL